MTRYVLGIDQGTTGTLVCLMDADGAFVAQADRSHEQHYPRPGWVEQDPDELWRNAAVLVNQVIAAGGVTATEIAAIGLANQGESIVAWDRATGEAISRVLVWQDTRTRAAVDALAADAALAAGVSARTGLRLDPYFSASKMRWCLDHAPGAADLLRQGRLAIGTLDSWLIYKLTAGRAFVTDVSTASRTLLLDIRTLEWDPWLLEVFGVPAEVLATVLPSAAEFGVTAHPDLACQGVPILASMVDQPAAMLGQGCVDAGQIKATYGTGCFVNLNTGAAPVTSASGLLTLLAWQLGPAPTYGLDGGVLTAAATVNWLKDGLRLFDDYAGMEALAATGPPACGPVWVPGQIGLGPPYWHRSARGAWLGIDLATDRAGLVRAVLEGIAARVAQIVRAMRADSGLALTSLRADGGLTASAALMQIQADLLGSPVEVAANTEATVSGVLAAAAVAAGLWPEDLLRRRARSARVFTPTLADGEREARLERFDRAVRQVMAWHDDD